MIAFLSSLAIPISVVNIGWDFFCCYCMVPAVISKVSSCAVVDLLLIVSTTSVQSTDSNAQSWLLVRT